MDTQTKLKAVLVAGATLLCLSGLPVQADDTTAQPDVMTLYLGKLPITGQQKIVDTLIAIKLALHEPMSNDPAKAGTVICRINKDTGSRREYLDCATNHDLAKRHEYSQEQMLARSTGLPSSDYGEALQQDFDGLVAQQPNHRLHVPINGGALQALINSLPDDAKVVDSGT
jgi:hypothetical protein